MSNFRISRLPARAESWLRGACLSVPVLLASLIAIYTVRAATTDVVKTGPITGTVTDYASFPNGTNVGTTAVAPIAMIVASTDEQLFYKAYTDYTDMLGTGSPQITYTDSFEYGGYFNPQVCYSYGSGTFTPQAAASGKYSHSCSKKYSGNFMNWATMSRLDMLRYAMYGGLRTTDTASKTVLTRALIPNDGHAWVKVYTGTDLSSYVPISGNSVSLCNATVGSQSGVTPVSAGLHIVAGTYTQWASTEYAQCGTSGEAAPTSGISDFTVSVQVCDGTYDKRSFCKTYGTSSIKPTGVLQKFGESDSAQQIQFALLSGSRTLPRSGGFLRKNAALIEGNLGSSNTADHTCSTSSNELALADGTFCTNNGIIQNLSEINLNTSDGYWEGNGNKSQWHDCTLTNIHSRYVSGITANGILDDPGKYDPNSTTTYHCGAWGNPVTEMYAEALRYLSGQTSATANFIGGSYAVSDDSLGMQTDLTWTPPLTDSNYCAACSIVLISSGQITFDADELPSLSGIVNYSSAASDINKATDKIGSAEGINGSSVIAGRYLTASTDLAVGNQVNTASDICQAKPVSKFSLVRGICPDGASMEGSYLLSGLAWQAWVNGIKASSITDNSNHQTKPVRTYAVSLSESMPTFQIPTYKADGSSAGTVTINPICQASTTKHRAAPEENGTIDDYRTCGLISLQLGQLQSSVSPDYYTYGQAYQADLKKGSLIVVWDNNPWGIDHDRDIIEVVSWCVGSACGSTTDTSATPSNFCWRTNLSSSAAFAAVSTVQAATSAACTNGHLAFVPSDNQVLIRTEALSTGANGDLSIGFSVSGSSSIAGSTVSSDGIHRTFYDTNGRFATILSAGWAWTVTTYPTDWSAPQVEVFTASTGATSATTLKNPLWYAAKYGGFTYTPASLGMPPATADTLPNTGTNNNWEGSDGNPSNYFLARNPTDLVTGLQKAFQQIANSGTSANDFGSTSSPTSINDYSGNGVSYQVQYFATRNGVNWNGSLQALWSDANGYLQEGGTADGSGNAIQSSNAPYVASGTDTSGTNASGALANYICSTTPTSTSFDPSASSACKIVSDSNPIVPVWNATTLLNAYYNPSDSSYTAIKANIEKQRAYADDAGASANLGQRYIFTYLTAAPNGQAAASSTTAATPAAGTLLTGTQTDFVWNTQCDSGSTCPSCTTAGACTPTTTSGFYGAVDPTVTTQRLGNYGLLNEQSPALAKSLLNWVRGEEDTGDWRSRTSTTANASTGAYSTFRLGDIINSSPAVVSEPDMGFDVNYNDFSYAAFHKNYLNRRQMVYVGANDGMLHAFNGGFYIPATTAVGKTEATPAMLARTLPAGSTTGSPISSAGNSWTLGQEAWAFVPDNLLPHLRWMADKTYTHVFYVDGSPVVTDAKLWTGDSATCQAGTAASGDIDSQGHVCGWGTIMVVPFRLGGGPITVDTVGDKKAASQQTSNSAYVILDITDPEQPPTVLGEITTGTYALGAPAFATHRESDGKVHFLLTVGSGPSDNGGPNGSGTKPVAAPSGNLGVWIYDLQNIVAQSTTPAAAFVGTTGNGPANSFAGDMASVDFDLNYSAEGIYFGTVATADASTSTHLLFAGGLWKVDLTSSGSDKSDPSSWSLKQVYNTGQPVTIRPTMALDTSNRRMIYFGTGRSYTPNDDSGSSAQGVQQQYIYGISDNSLLSGLPSSGCTTTLFDASSVSVTASGAVSASSGSLPNDATSLANLEGALLAKTANGCYQYSGWKMALAAGNSAASVKQPSERIIVNQVVYNGILYTTSYTPPNAAQIIASGYSNCNPIPVPGVSSEYGLDYLTGTASPSLASPFGSTGGSVNKSAPLGTGKASAPTIHNGTLSVGIDGTTKNISAAKSGSTNGVETSWREETDNQ